MIDPDIVKGWFEPAGLLEKDLPSYEYRPQQTELAEFIANVLLGYGDKAHALIEAPTGVGKTLAYLVPLAADAKQFQKKSLIATPTIALQEQLMKDLDLVKVMFPGLDIEILKGRSHYACLCKLNRKLRDPKLSTTEQKTLLDVLDYTVLETGYKRAPDRNDYNFADQDILNKYWMDISAQFCDKPVVKTCENCAMHIARKKTDDADIVVTSHALLLYSTINKNMITVPDTIVIDEAHKFIDATTQMLGDERKIGIPRVFPQLMSLGLHTTLGYEIESFLKDIATKGTNPVLLNLTSDQISRAVYLKGRFDELLTKLAKVRKTEDTAVIANEARAELLALAKFFTNLTFDHANWIRWSTKTHVSMAPVSVSNFLYQRLWINRKAILLSATLKRLNKFDNIQYGFNSPQAVTIPGYFDYPRQCMLVLPDMPDPDHPVYAKKLANLIKAAYGQLNGSIMCLFTSYKALDETLQLLQSVPTLVQGRDGDAATVLERFRNENAILLGTASLWEGIDLVGDSLRCLFITRLPFDVPTDPLHQARAKIHKDPFMGYSLPRASIKLKQGFGRLIRSKLDKGICVITDSRLQTARYGPLLLRDLPQCNLFQGDDVAGAIEEWFRSPQ